MSKNRSRRSNVGRSGRWYSVLRYMPILGGGGRKRRGILWQMEGGRGVQAVLSVCNEERQYMLQRSNAVQPWPCFGYGDPYLLKNAVATTRRRRVIELRPLS